jgi:dTDP-3,4-didehydro-2,6-dideoxy-alpha-D-glucose 3-reductase
VDVGFSLAVRFANGVRYTGHFSFEAEYQNRLTLVTRHGSLIVERLFSPPADIEPVWQMRESNQAREQRMPAADVFRCFLEAVLEAVHSGEHGEFHSNMMADAAFRADIERQLLSNAR